MASRHDRNRRTWPRWNATLSTATIAPLESGASAANLWVEVLCLVLFALASSWVARIFLRTLAAARGASHSSMDAGVKSRRHLLGTLLAASVMRCVSLALSLALVSSACPVPWICDLSPQQRRWVEELMALLPAVLFLTAFSVLVLFWARLHYSSTIVPQPVLDCMVLGINIACYLMLSVVALITLMLKAYDHLRGFMICVIGILSLALAVTVAHFGQQVYNELAGSAKKTQLSWRRPIPRILALAIVCPVALSLRGICFMAWAFSIGSPSMLGHLSLVMLCEWAPLITAMVALGPAPSGIVELEECDEDSDASDAGAQPLLPAPTSNLFIGKDGAWVQVHPQLPMHP